MIKVYFKSVDTTNQMGHAEATVHANDMTDFKKHLAVFIAAIKLDAPVAVAEMA